MTIKQQGGMYSPDGSAYVTMTDGAGNIQSVAAGTVVGSTSIAASSGNVAAATATATLTGAASQTTYITGFQINGSGATAASVVNATITGLVGGATLTYPVSVTAGAILTNQPVTVSFYPPLPASAANTSIVISCPSLGAGNTNNAVNAQGYRL